MKLFLCDHCQQLVFFENTQCVNCHHLLAYLTDLQVIGSLELLQNNIWVSPIPRPDGERQTYRLCQNYEQENVCNWATPVQDNHPLCRSCRLTRVIPNLSEPANKNAWYRLEAAKRRLVHTLLSFNLPLENKNEDPEGGLAFELLSDPQEPGAPPVLTGHSEGVITISIAEADDVEREKRRVQLHEPYRTLLGHFRHEVGHYYWERLLLKSNRLEAFRELFGDERQSYADALDRHYKEGPPAGWQQSFVTAYATMHPWEDWAETWAHYLHITDVLETAAASGLSLHPQRPGEPELPALQLKNTSNNLDEMMKAWFPLTHLLNNLNRSMGMPDAYPFVLSTPSLAKLRFVHQTIRL